MDDRSFNPHVLNPGFTWQVFLLSLFKVLNFIATKLKHVFPQASSKFYSGVFGFYTTSTPTTITTNVTYRNTKGL